MGKCIVRTKLDTVYLQVSEKKKSQEPNRWEQANHNEQYYRKETWFTFIQSNSQLSSQIQLKTVYTENLLDSHLKENRQTKVKKVSCIKKSHEP